MYLEMVYDATGFVDDTTTSKRGSISAILVRSV
jgi:hypothetical protein